MAGYHGWSMSNNAVDCYENGIKPISKWSKEDILIASEDLKNELEVKLDMDKLSKCNLYTLKKELLVSNEWHHTGGDFKKTDFYEVSIGALEDFIEKGYPNENQPKKEVKNDFDKGYVHGTYKEVIYHPTSKYNKYKENWINFQNGKIKGNWVILENGKKKSLNNCNIEKRTKNKRRIKNKQEKKQGLSHVKELGTSSERSSSNKEKTKEQER